VVQQMHGQGDILKSGQVRREPVPDCRPERTFTQKEQAGFPVVLPHGVRKGPFKEQGSSYLPRSQAAS